MASAVAAVANGGVLSPPRIVRGTRAPDGTLELEPPPERREVITPRTAAQLTRILENVVSHGTGQLAAVSGYRVAGKTGTSRRHVEGAGYSEDHYASFAGFAPSRDPRLVCLVVLDSPQGDRYYGGQIAAPVFARIMGPALAHLRVPPDRDDRVLTLRVPGREPRELLASYEEPLAGAEPSR